MKIASNNLKPNNLSFKAGRAILFTDFDGTFLAQPLDDLYNGSKETKTESVKNFNLYFKDFQDYINKTKNKFEINITTGRRLNGDNKEGFEPTYLKMKSEGITLPKINSLITTSGGDVYHFNSSGAINTVQDSSKAVSIKEACGWDNLEIKNTLDEIAKNLETSYEFVDKRGSYKLSIDIQDESKLESFFHKAKAELSKKMDIDIKIGSIKNKGKTDGIKIQPLIKGHHLHKDFDVKLALDKAIKENDFIVVAGDANNDKEALNIFNYLKNPPNAKVPTHAEDISKDYISKTKDEINSLPIKILFINPPKNETNPKTLSLADFMKKTSELFPQKVQIVEQTEVGKNNKFLDAIKLSINDYANENLDFAKNFSTKTFFKTLINKAAPVIFFLGATLGCILNFYKRYYTKEPINKETKNVV